MSNFEFFDRPIKRDDEAGARRWRGQLFRSFHSPLMWKDKYYKTLKRPNSVTFPICEFCHHIVREWPHYEEPVPPGVICDQCFKEEEKASRRDAARE